LAFLALFVEETSSVAKVEVRNGKPYTNESRKVERHY
jgi:hypothetical protein